MIYGLWFKAYDLRRQRDDDGYEYDAIYNN